MKQIRSFLAKVEPFERLPGKELDRLAQSAQELTHSKGEHIFSEGEEATSVWVLKSGRLEIYKYTSDGKPRMIETISPGDLFGTLCRIGGENRFYPCTSVVASDTVSIRLSDKIFLNLFQKYPGMVSGVCTLCSQRLSRMQDLSCMTQEPVEKRIAKILLDLNKKHGSSLPYTKREISEMVGTTVETAIRTMSKFQKENWISSARGKIDIKDPDKLQSLLN